MEVIKFPDSRLFVKCREVTVYTPELKVLLDSMWETMELEKGIGLAANQVGLEYQMFVMKSSSQEKLYIVNPKITEYSKNPSSIKEGCLSAPGQMINLYRPNWIRLTYKDENGAAHSKVFVDVDSVCAQHEMEHLEGKSFLQNKAIPKKLRIFLAKKWGFKVK